jgi:hypothetical protein
MRRRGDGLQAIIAVPAGVEPQRESFGEVLRLLCENPICQKNLSDGSSCPPPRPEQYTRKVKSKSRVLRNRTAGTHRLQVPGHPSSGCIPAAFGVPLVGVQKSALGGVGAMPCWPKAGDGVTQRGGLRSSRCALTGVVGFRLSTGIASDVVDAKTKTEAGCGVVTGFVRAAGWAA